MKNLGAMANSRYIGFREITDRDVLELHCKTLFMLISAEHEICPGYKSQITNNFKFFPIKHS